MRADLFSNTPMLEVFIRAIIGDFTQRPPDQDYESFIREQCEKFVPFTGVIEKLIAVPQVADREMLAEGRKFAEWFNVNFKPTHITASNAQIDKWAQEYEKMRRIDRKTKEEIIAAVKWAREDEFWSKNFLTPMKLRSKDKQGVMYIDLFLEKLKETKSKSPEKMVHKKGVYNPVTGVTK